MPQSDFYTLNLQRSFPLCELPSGSVASYELWYPLIADMQITFYREAEYVDGLHHVRIDMGGRMPSRLVDFLQLPPGDYVFISVHCTAPLMTDQVMVFSLPLDAPQYSRTVGRRVSGKDFAANLRNPQRTSQRSPQSLAWHGWAVFGRPRDFPATLLNADREISLEPARVRNVAESPPVSGFDPVHVFNKNRTYFEHPEPCAHMPEVPKQSPGLDYVRTCGPLTDPVKLGGGFQITTYLQAESGEVTISGSPGGGDLPVPCDPPQLDDAFTPLPGRGEDGAFTCQEVLRSVNGVGGPDVDIVALQGVNVGAFQEFNRVVISLSGETLADCPDFDPPQPVEYIPTDDDGNPCGEYGALPPKPEDPTEPPSGSSTTTLAPGDSVDPINCGGNCLWVAAGIFWDLKDYPCQSPCHCEEPDQPPSPGLQLTTTACLELLPTDPDNPVRNSDFVEPGSSLAAWDVTGQVNLIDSYPGIPDTEFPMVRMRGDQETILRQNKIRVRPRQAYDLTLDFYLISGGELNIKITDLADQVLLERTVNDQEYRRDYVLGSFSTVQDGVNLLISRKPGQPELSAALLARPAILSKN